MILNTSKGRRWTIALGAAAAAIGLTAATPAQAYWHHGGWGGWGWGPRVSVGIGFGGFYPGYAYGYGYPGYVYAPRVYAPPVAYYAPPPAYYPPPTAYSHTAITSTTRTHHKTAKHHVSHKAAPPCSCQSSAPEQAPAPSGSSADNAVQQTNPSAESKY